MKILTLLAVILAALLVIASGIWVGTSLLRSIFMRSVPYVDSGNSESTDEGTA